MVRSYEVDVHLEENLFGFILLCFEGDEVVHDQFFRDSADAHAVGNMFLDGRYVKTLMLEDVA